MKFIKNNPQNYNIRNSTLKMRLKPDKIKNNTSKNQNTNSIILEDLDSTTKRDYYKSFEEFNKSFHKNETKIINENSKIQYSNYEKGRSIFTTETDCEIFNDLNLEEPFGEEKVIYEAVNTRTIAEYSINNDFPLDYALR